MIWKAWGYRLAASTIKGVAGSVLGFFGVAGANASGLVATPNLDWQQLAVLAVSGAVVGLFSYLRTEPLP